MHKADHGVSATLIGRWQAMAPSTNLAQKGFGKRSAPSAASRRVVRRQTLHSHSLPVLCETSSSHTWPLPPSTSSDRRCGGCRYEQFSRGHLHHTPHIQSKEGSSCQVTDEERRCARPSRPIGAGMGAPDDRHCGMVCAVAFARPVHRNRGDASDAGSRVHGGRARFRRDGHGGPQLIPGR